MWYPPQALVMVSAFLLKWPSWSFARTSTLTPDNWNTCGFNSNCYLHATESKRTYQAIAQYALIISYIDSHYSKADPL
jgi:hypothetical protein